MNEFVTASKSRTVTAHGIFNNNEYQDDGVDYVILGVTNTQIFTFGVAWINNCTENNEVQTWFGADPTIMKL